MGKPRLHLDNGQRGPLCNNPAAGHRILWPAHDDYEVSTCKKCRRIRTQDTRMDRLEAGNGWIVEQLARDIELDQTAWPAWEGQEI